MPAVNGLGPTSLVWVTRDPGLRGGDPRQRTRPHRLRAGRIRLLYHPVGFRREGKGIYDRGQGRHPGRRQGHALAPYSTVLPKALMPIGEGTVIDSMLKLFRDAGVSTVYHHRQQVRPSDPQLLRRRQPLGPRDRLRRRVEAARARSARWTRSVTASTAHSSLPTRTSTSTWTSRTWSRRTAQKGPLLTVVVTNQEVKIEYGVLDRQGNRVTGFREKPTERVHGQHRHLLHEPGIFGFVPPTRRSGSTNSCERCSSRTRRSRAYPHLGTWIDIGRIEDLRRAQEQAAHPILEETPMPMRRLAR